ncbi:hypothetical protein [Nonomuraea sp. SYSU D8015]|uniref:hypothetical protein n=1 Tax=Nonomuraea sp. SYSU D8015 TaxID=2593644 RepID=UPI001660EA95|nr:hypothetical protein [Nonomuraea sp. SYSU D8015]
MTIAALAAFTLSTPPPPRSAAADSTASAQVETPAPEGEAPPPEEETPAPEEDSPAPEQDTPAAEEDSQAPEQDTPAPEVDTPAPEDSQAPEDEAGAAPQDPEGQTPAATPSATPTARAARADYAGRVQGTRGLIAISIRGAKAIGYFCDGKTEIWFQGTASDGRVSLKSTGGSTVTAAFNNTRATGELRTGAKRWNFTAQKVRKPSGLYKATAQIRGATLTAGWIYLPDGTRVGAANLDGVLIPVEIPEPGQPTVIEGTEIDPQDVDEFLGAR